MMLKSPKLFTYLLLCIASHVALATLVNAADADDINIGLDSDPDSDTGPDTVPKRLRLILPIVPKLEDNATEKEKEARNKQIEKAFKPFKKLNQLKVEKKQDDGQIILYVQETFLEMNKSKVVQDDQDIKKLITKQWKKVLDYVFWEENLKLQCNGIYQGASDQTLEDDLQPFLYGELLTEEEDSDNMSNTLRISVDSYWFSNKQWVIIVLLSGGMSVASYFGWKNREAIQKELFPNSMKEK